MTYLIIIGCKNPSTAKPYKKAFNENVIFGNYEEASLAVERLNRVDGDGYARVIVL